MSRSQKINIKDLLGYKIKKTQHALRTYMDESLKTINLTTPQYAVLAQLELEKGVSNAELARKSFITPQTMHGIILNLEKRSLLKREKSLDHGRILYNKITKQGIEAVQKAHHLISDIEGKMTDTIDQNQKSLLEDLLSKCLNNLKRNMK